MRRWLVWTFGGLVALSLLAAYALSSGRPGGDAAASKAPGEHAGAAPQEPGRGPAAAGVGAGRVETEPSPEHTEAVQKRLAEHQQNREEHRAEVRERARKRREEIEHRLEQRAAFEATRAPDPNRPRPEVPRLDLGPAVIPDSDIDGASRP